jgi:hypothetical protein
MRSSDSLSNIAPALVAALGEIEGAAKKAKNPHFKSSYANLETVIDASRDVLTGHGLTVLQGPGAMCEGRLSLTTRLIHTSGEWVESTLEIPVGKLDPQGTGSAITYARRYSLMAMLNMPAVDDDGEAALGRGRPAPQFAEPPVDPENSAAVVAAKVAIDTCGDLAILKKWQADNAIALEQLPTEQYNAVARYAKSKAQSFRQKEAA